MFPFLAFIILEEGEWRSLQCIPASSKVYMAHEVQETLGEMGLRTFEMH